MKETQPTEILSLLNKLCDEVSHELDDTKQRIIHPMLEINLILAIKQLNFLKKDIEDINKRFSSLNVEEAVREISRLPKIGYSIGQTFYGGLKFITGAASILTVHGASKGVRVAER